MAEKIVLVDGYSLLYRAFHALPLMDNGEGQYTNAIYGFLSMLLKVLSEEKPAYCAVAFDEHAPTFRHLRYEAYKAGRAPTPEEMRPQVEMLRGLLKEIGICQAEMAGFEADDLMGTLSRSAAEQGTESILVTGDRDSFQLIGDHTRVWFTRKGLSEIEDLSPEKLVEGYGVRPDQVPDLKGLMGDASDNIPGIPGVGEKTALKLLGEYDKLENVLEHAGEIKGKLGEKVRAGAETARLSKELATIDRNAPVEFDKRIALLPQDPQTLFVKNTVIEDLLSVLDDAPRDRRKALALEKARLPLIARPFAQRNGRSSRNGRRAEFLWRRAGAGHGGGNCLVYRATAGRLCAVRAAGCAVPGRQPEPLRTHTASGRPAQRGNG